MKILFINGSPNKNGNTAQLAKALLGNRQYETLNLTDYRINFAGQTLPGDEFDQVLQKIRQAEVIVLGSPVYWHNLCGSIRTMLDRFYGSVENGSLRGRELYFLFQGGAPEKWMLESGEYTIQRFAKLYGLTYKGMASDAKSAKELGC
jgi:multimeric flavodoxin WrbA